MTHSDVVATISQCLHTQLLVHCLSFSRVRQGKTMPQDHWSVRTHPPD